MAQRYNLGVTGFVAKKFLSYLVVVFPRQKTPTKISNILWVGSLITMLMFQFAYAGTSTYTSAVPVSYGSTTPCTSPLIQTINVIDNIVIDDLNVIFKASHTWRTDTNMTLTSPAGTTVNLLTGPYGSNFENYNVIFDDEATIVVDTGAHALNQPVTGTPISVQSESDPLSNFDSENALGIWTFSICDVYTGSDNGTILELSFEITFPDPPILTCPAGFALANLSGNATAVETAAVNSTRALGAISSAGTTANSVSANNNSSNPILGLELANLVPEGATITLSLAKNNNGGNSIIETSDDGLSYDVQTNHNTGTLDILTHVTITAPVDGVKFIRIRRVSGSVWIDGISYDESCVKAVLNGSKTVDVYDPNTEGLYALPGNDVIYTITASNTGDGDADTDSVVLIDKFPAELEFWNGDIDAGGGSTYAGTDPVGFVDVQSSGLTFNYGTDVRFSTSTSQPANFAACTTVTPTETYRPDLKYICFNPKGIFQAGDPDPTFSVSFRGRIK